MGLRSLRCLICSTQLLVSYVCKLERRQPQGQQCTTVPTRHPNTIRSATLSRLYLVDKSGSISGIQHGALSLRFFSYSQYEPCPRLTPMLLPLPTFNLLSTPPWTHMRGKQKATYSLIPLPPSYSPATRPPPSCLSSKS